MKYFRKLVGEGIYLSPRSIEDAEIYTQWLNDFDTTDFLGKSGRLITLEDEKKYLEDSTNTNDVTFSIITLDRETMIGTIGLSKVDYINRTATLGIFIGNKEQRNAGYGAEAISLILDYAFNYMNLNNIVLQVMEFNLNAIKCYQKCGFREAGRRRNALYINGNYYDTIYMDILKEEFQDEYIINKNI